MGGRGIRQSIIAGMCDIVFRRRPYRVEYTGSLPTSEVKRRRARLVLGWGTAREDLRVLSASSCATAVPLTGAAISVTLIPQTAGSALNLPG